MRNNNITDFDRNLLIEEYKCHHTQIIAFDNDIHKWSAAYIVALFVSIGWFMVQGNRDSLSTSLSGADGAGLAVGFCFLFIQVINAIYMLWIIRKLLQTQHLRLYLAERVSPLLRGESIALFSTFDSYRRTFPENDELPEARLTTRRRTENAFVILPVMLAVVGYFYLTTILISSYNKLHGYSNVILWTVLLVLNVLSLLFYIFIGIFGRKEFDAVENRWKEVNTLANNTNNQNCDDNQQAINRSNDEPKKS